MIAIVCGILFSLGGASTSPLANQYMDNVIHSALRAQLRLAHLDPAVLPDFTTEFEDKVAIIGKVKGHARYNHGNLTGLSQVRRNSECQGPSNTLGYATINCTLTFEDLQTSFNGKVKYGKMPIVHIKGNSNITSTSVFVEVASGHETSLPFLKKFHFQQMGGMKTKVTGLGPLNRVFKFLEGDYNSQVNAQVHDIMNSRFQYAFNIAASQVPMPT